MSYIYLHGFASGPQSAKAKDLGDRFQSIGIPLIVPDLNQDDFSHLTLTRQIQQMEAELLSSSQPVTLIGSSFGGLTAVWLAERLSQVQRLILLAPAFQFLTHWLPRLSIAQAHHWQSDRYLPVYHYRDQRMLPLHYDFVTDAAQYDETHLQRPVPTLILHGQQDDVIPMQSSRDYAQSRPWVELVELESDHALTNVQTEIWEAVCRFCHLPNQTESITSSVR